MLDSVITGLFCCRLQAEYFLTFVVLMQTGTRKHILFLARWYPHYYDPMYGLFVERHARAVALYHDVSVIYILPVDADIQPFEEIHEETHFLEVKYYYSKAGISGRLLSPFRYYNYFRKAYQTVISKRSKPDLVHVNVLTRVGVLARLLKFQYRTPYIITEHWSRYLSRRNGYQGFMRKLITPHVVKHAGGLTTVTDNLREAMKNHGLIARRTVTIPNVVDVDFFRPPLSKQHHDKTIFIHLSCFEERSKNMSGILQAVKQLSKERQDFLLYMVGEGVDWDKTVREAEKLQLKDKFVYFTGLKQGQELLQLMQRADIMVLYSHYENLPVVILEAFSCGMPVISSNVGGIAEHLSDERGILIPPGDSLLLAHTMEKMMEKLPEFDHDRIRNYAVNHFSMKVVGSQFDHLYQKVLLES